MNLPDLTDGVDQKTVARVMVKMASNILVDLSTKKEERDPYLESAITFLHNAHVILQNKEVRL